MPKLLNIETAVSRGLMFLEKHQEADGSFVSFSSASMRPFRRQRSWQTTFVPALILASLAGLDYPAALDVRRRLAGFLLDQKDDHWAFNYWARSAPEYRAMPYPNDLDDTFCALAALHLHDPELINGAVLAQAVKLLLATEARVGGPYRSWLVPKGSEPVWLDVDTAVNSNVAYFLFLTGNRLPSLDKLIGQAIATDTFTSPYYPSVYAFIYYFARAYEGPRTNRLLRKARQLHKGAMTDLDRALCLSARSRLHDKQELAGAASELLAGQRRDGSWPAAAFYADPVKNGRPYYNGGAALTTAFVLEALQLYVSRQQPSLAQVKPLAVRQGGTDKAAVLSSAREQCHLLPSDLRRTILRSLTKLANGSNGDEIIGLPRTFNQSLRKPLAAGRDDFLGSLGLANLYGWLSYTVYDDFLDEEGQPGLLPAANVTMRKSLHSFLESLPDDQRFQQLVHEVFNVIDGANAWELTHCRFRRKGHKLVLGVLPDYDDLSKLAERSLGHTLAPIAILCAQKSSTGALRHTREAWAQYLIVRQLNDDLHDWQEDLGSGHITYVVSHILTGLGLKPGSYDVTALTAKAGKQFWYKTLPSVCREMRHHIIKGRRAIDQAGIFKEAGDIGHLFDGLEASIEETLAEQAQAENFLKHYGKEPVKL